MAPEVQFDPCDACDACDACPKRALYELSLAHDTRCRACREVLQSAGLTLRVCKKNCKHLYWTVESFRVDGLRVNALMFMEDDECGACGTRNDHTGLFEGRKIV